MVLWLVLCAHVGRPLTRHSAPFTVSTLRFECGWLSIGAAVLVYFAVVEIDSCSDYILLGTAEVCRWKLCVWLERWRCWLCSDSQMRLSVIPPLDLIYFLGVTDCSYQAPPFSDRWTHTVETAEMFQCQWTSKCWKSSCGTKACEAVQEAEGPGLVQVLTPRGDATLKENGSSAAHWGATLHERH